MSDRDRPINYFDELIERSPPGNAAAAERILSLPEIYRQQSSWLAITRIVIATYTTATGAPLDAQRVTFYTDDDLTALIDIAPTGNNSNDLSSPILIRPGDTLHAVWPAHTSARSLKMRVQGQIVSTRALGI